MMDASFVFVIAAFLMSCIFIFGTYKLSQE